MKGGLIDQQFDLLKRGLDNSQKSLYNWIILNLLLII
jgi:hypothetical protein